MTVSTSKRLKRHVGNGATTVFPYDFYIPNEESLEVYLYDSDTGLNQLLNSSVYSVTGIGDDNFGEVTYPLSGSPITSTQTLTIRRVVEYDQNTSIRNQSGFFPEVIENALDHLTFQTQQNAEDLSRATVVPLEDETDMTLPGKTNRVSKVAGWDSAGKWTALSQLDKSADTVTTPSGTVPRSLAERFADTIAAKDYGFVMGATGAQIRSALNAAATVASAQGKRLVLHGGSYEIDGEWTLPGDLVIETVGQALITLTASAVCMIHTDYNLEIFGDRLTLDADGNQIEEPISNRPTGIIYCHKYLPKIENVTAKNGLVGFGTANAYGEIFKLEDSEGYYRRCYGDECTHGAFLVNGNNGSKVGDVLFEDCRSSGLTTGTYAGNSRLIAANWLNSVVWRGGDFTGDPNTSCTNGFECNSLEVIGGNYHDCLRGPTAGRNTIRGRIVGTSVENASEIGIAVDTTTGTGETDSWFVVTGNVMRGCGRGFRSTGSFVSVTGNMSFDSTNASGDFAFAGEGTNLVCSNNLSFRSDTSNYYAFIATEGAQVQFGRNFTNSIVTNTFGSGGSTAYGIFSNVQLVDSSPADISMATDVVLVDTSGGPITLRLPGHDISRNIGKQIKIFRVDGLDRFTLTVRNNKGTINGTTGQAFDSSSEFMAVDVVCTGGDNAWVVAGLQHVRKEAWGKAEITPDGNGNGTIAHGLAEEPTTALVGIRGDHGNGVDVESVDSTNITVRVKDASGADVTAGTFTVDWIARI